MNWVKALVSANIGRTRSNNPTGRIWSAGRSFSMFDLASAEIFLEETYAYDFPDAGVLFLFSLTLG